MSSVWVWVASATAALAVWWWLADGRLNRLEGGRRSPWAWWERIQALRPPSRHYVARAEALRGSVPHVCSLLAVCLDAGAPPRTALREVAEVIGGPAGPDLAAVVHRIDAGIDEAQAWRHLDRVPGYRDVARDVARAVISGLGLSDLLRHHADEARRDLANAALVRARSAGVRGVIPLMLCFLPAFIALGVIPIFGSFTFHLPLP